MLFAKRAIPIRVPSIIYNGFEYRVVHFSDDEIEQNGGMVEVYNTSTGNKIETIIVYKINYDSHKEKDIQDIFITRMELLDNNKIRIYNENDEIFDLDLETLKVYKVEYNHNKY